MELRHLRYFVAVAEELHFGRAALRLRVSQPPVSQQIRQLEAELGVELFSRTKRRVKLTHAGAAFLGDARKTLHMAEKAAQTASRANRGEMGPLAVGCAALAVPVLLPQVLPAFRTRFPEVDLNLSEAPATEILRDLEDGVLDAGLLVPNFDSKVLRREIILSDPMCVALPKDHPAADHQSIRLSRLARERFITFPEGAGPGFHNYIIGWCQQAGFTPDTVHVATHLPTLLVMVAAGYGIALIPASLKSQIGERLAIVRLQSPCPSMQLCLAWNPLPSPLSPVLQGFLGVVRLCRRQNSRRGGSRR